MHIIDKWKLSGSQKAAANIKNHDSVTFEEAEPCTFDPFALTHEDNDAQGEQRFVSLGMGRKRANFRWLYTLIEKKQYG